MVFSSQPHINIFHSKNVPFFFFGKFTIITKIKNKKIIKKLTKIKFSWTPAHRIFKLTEVFRLTKASYKQFRSVAKGKSEYDTAAKLQQRISRAKLIKQPSLLPSSSTCHRQSLSSCTGLLR